MSVSYYDDEAPISLAEKIMIGSVVLMFVFAFFNSVRACGGPCVPPSPPITVSPPPIVVPPPLPPPVTVSPGKNPPSAPVGGGGVSVSGGGPTCLVQGTCPCFGLQGKFLWSCLQNPPQPAGCGFMTGRYRELCENQVSTPIPKPSIELPVKKPNVIHYKG